MFRPIFHLMRADFWERTRRYSFLITIGLLLYVAYIYLPPASASYLGFALGDVRGIYNSAWIGSIIAVLCSVLLILPGFYLVKNAVQRDLDTRVGEIIATTPISKWGYTFGKTLSNFAYLAAMVGVIALGGLAMQLIRGETMQIEIWSYLSPFVYTTLPTIFLISALAVLFEAIPWLRGGFGNILFAVLWLAVLIISISLSETSDRLRPTADPLGMTNIVYSMIESASEYYPVPGTGFVIGGSSVHGSLQTFVWNGMAWTSRAILGRLIWIGVGVGFTLLAAVLFNRFDPATEHPRRKKGKKEVLQQVEEPAEAAAAILPVRLTRLESRRGNPISLFGRTLLAELRLMLKGTAWWWYLVALGLVIGCLFAPLDVTRSFLLPVAWVWPILLWSAMGNRETRHHTEQIVFSTAHPLRTQLPTAWGAGWIVALITGAGVAIRLGATGQNEALLAWLTGSLFIPSLALALGTWSGSSKLFEVVYLLWWYVGPVNKAETLDFMGTGENVQADLLWPYWVGTGMLIVLAILGRWRQIRQ